MASPRKPAKQSSGWGGFLQQAVASVESRLDTILADDSDSANQAIIPVTPTKENVASQRRTYSHRCPRYATMLTLQLS